MLINSTFIVEWTAKCRNLICHTWRKKDIPFYKWKKKRLAQEYNNFKTLSRYSVPWNIEGKGEQCLSSSFTFTLCVFHFVFVFQFIFVFSWLRFWVKVRAKVQGQGQRQLDGWKGVMRRLNVRVRFIINVKVIFCPLFWRVKNSLDLFV